ncbi:MAG: hypothetical protein ACI9BD_001160 [Candidatus Marinamargulisbacteria bacterium]|jgi:hypothetical protein
MDNKFSKESGNEEPISTEDLLTAMQNLARSVHGKEKRQRKPTSKWTKRLRRQKSVRSLRHAR